MRIHYLQHVPFEDLGSMDATLVQRGHTVSATRLYAGESLPDIHELDALIVMGGPMGVADSEDYPWLTEERAWIADVIAAGLPVLGVCLGAQLIAAALGARVYANPHREIGWFPIYKADEADSTILGSVFPQQQEVFHWHGETFGLPAGARLLASSEACINQGFVYRDRVFALQFHLETTPESAQRLIEHCRDELDGSAWVQDANQILSYPDRFAQVNRMMDGVLEKLEQAARKNL